MREIKQPTTPNEIVVYEIWKRALGHDAFGIDDDFFEAGGTSMGALQVISDLSERFEFDINDFFIAPNVRNIASGLQENPDAMKDHLKNVLEFRPSKSKNPTEWKVYEERFKQIVDVQKDERAYRNILVLGATGFLGVYLLREILKQSTAQVAVLVRGVNGEARLEKHYNYFFGEDAFNAYRNRIKIVIGDLTKSKMGISDEEYKALAVSIDAIVNSAALVKHMGKNSEFENTNIDIVKCIIEFANQGCKKVIHHMSTLGVTYGEQGENEKTLFTEYDERIAHELTNQYLASKYEAECVLLEARKEGVESTIYRMNGILFDSKTGKYQENMAQSTNYVFYRGLYKLGIIPRGMVRPMDISNVDMISEAVVKILYSNQSRNEIYHIVNPNTLEISEILKMIGGEKSEGHLKVMSADEAYEYYTKSSEMNKKYFNEIAFECEIIGAIGKNEFNICMEKTVHILRQLGFTWNIPNKEAIQRAVLEAQRVGFAE